MQSFLTCRLLQLITNSLGGELSSSQNKDPEDKKAYVLIDYAVRDFVALHAYCPTDAVRFLILFRSQHSAIYLAGVGASLKAD